MPPGPSPSFHTAPAMPPAPRISEMPSSPAATSSNRKPTDSNYRVSQKYLSYRTCGSSHPPDATDCCAPPCEPNPLPSAIPYRARNTSPHSDLRLKTGCTSAPKIPPGHCCRAAVAQPHRAATRCAHPVPCTARFPRLAPAASAKHRARSTSASAPFHAPIACASSTGSVSTCASASPSVADALKYAAPESKSESLQT